jgi:hypothetical protein
MAFCPCHKHGCSPSFGKTLFTRTLRNILNERSVENFDTAAIVLFLVPFIFIPCFEY